MVKSCESDPNEVEIVAAVLTDGAVTGGLNIPIHLKKLDNLLGKPHIYYLDIPIDCWNQHITN